ncbi:Tim44-like domain-containing protein [Methylomarinum sp. Ch1-1]|uniref:Tim44-like domain-containing protein n=1 Tax=Methylomarinum roseum TaxID=3067653 RepID=A0AAU7NWG0_9GAMM|nr:Tim44-like domain-containing protein [Methylomarinum sp. Ch1-1]MDP4522604.1 Tim44-like domain-containing protein [Methylomarinum sp. Ch1-1]
MNKFFGLAATLIMTLTFSLGAISDAEAKRFGGARSFGGKSAYSSPYRRSTTSQSSRSASQQQAHNKNQALKQNLSKRGGLMGMLGALALGGLLGSLLFGGAFEGFNFMDILIFGGIAYLLYRLFAAKAGQTPSPAYSRNDGHDTQTPFQYRDNQQTYGGNSSEFDTDVLFNKDKTSNMNTRSPAQQDADFTPAMIPDGFNEQDFLAGAEIAFRSLQTAWDNRDLAEIRGLTTDKVFAEIKEQLQANDEEDQTDVLKLQAELLEVREIGSELEAVVLFDAIMRENANEQAEQIREVWHFIKPKTSIQPKWYLDGIQQLEN